MKRDILILFAVSLVIAGILSWFASPEPDGLERVAIDNGFEETAGDHPIEVMPDYEVPGVHRLAAAPLAGVLGTVVVFVVVVLAGKIIVLRRRANRR